MYGSVISLEAYRGRVRTHRVRAGSRLGFWVRSAFLLATNRALVCREVQIHRRQRANGRVRLEVTAIWTTRPGVTYLPLEDVDRWLVDTFSS